MARWTSFEGEVRTFVGHRSGGVLTDEELDALAAEVDKADYDVEALQRDRRRPSGCDRVQYAADVVTVTSRP